MKTRNNIVAVLSLLAFLILGAVTVDAQIVYGASLVQYVPSTQKVRGESITYLDYVAGSYYDPVIIADLYRTDNPETSLDDDSDVGWEWSVPAYVQLETTNYVPGKTYCTFGNHRIRAYYYYTQINQWWDPWGYGFGPGSGGGPWGNPGAGVTILGPARSIQLDSPIPAL